MVASRAIENMNLLRIDEETTANIGIVKGGIATNIVMPELEIVAEARSLSEEKLDESDAAKIFDLVAEQADVKYENIKLMNNNKN